MVELWTTLPPIALSTYPLVARCESIVGVIPETVPIKALNPDVKIYCIWSSFPRPVKFPWSLIATDPLDWPCTPLQSIKSEPVSVETIADLGVFIKLLLVLLIVVAIGVNSTNGKSVKIKLCSSTCAPSWASSSVAYSFCPTIPMTPWDSSFVAKKCIRT